MDDKLDVDAALTALSLAQKVHSVLTGHHPAIQGAALADLLATWLAGHEPEVREALLDAHVHQVREFLSISDWRRRHG